MDDYYALTPSSGDTADDANSADEISNDGKTSAAHLNQDLKQETIRDADLPVRAIPSDSEVTTADEANEPNAYFSTAEATMNISLAALGDTIRQQIENRQQEIKDRLSLLYAQRAELTERIVATGDVTQTTNTEHEG